MTGLEKVIGYIFVKKGIGIGLGVGLMKLMHDIRVGGIRKTVMITDLIGAIVMGYAAFEVIALTEISIYLQIIWTVFMSANAFLVVAFITDREFFNEVMSKYLIKK